MTVPAIFEGRLAIPVIAAPLFIISHPALTLAQCKAGVVGSFPALNARPVEQLDEWLHQLREELDAFSAANPGRPESRSSRLRLPESAGGSLQPCGPQTGLGA